MKASVFLIALLFLPLFGSAMAQPSKPIVSAWWWLTDEQGNVPSYSNPTAWQEGLQALKAMNFNTVSLWDYQFAWGFRNWKDTLTHQFIQYARNFGFKVIVTLAETQSMEPLTIKLQRLKPLFRADGDVIIGIQFDDWNRYLQPSELPALVSMVRRVLDWNGLIQFDTSYSDYLSLPSIRSLPNVTFEVYCYYQNSRSVALGTKWIRDFYTHQEGLLGLVVDAQNTTKPAVGFNQWALQLGMAKHLGFTSYEYYAWVRGDGEGLNMMPTVWSQVSALNRWISA